MKKKKKNKEKTNLDGFTVRSTKRFKRNNIVLVNFKTQGGTTTF